MKKNLEDFYHLLEVGAIIPSKNLEDFYNFLSKENFKDAELEILRLLGSNSEDFLILNNYGIVLCLKKDFLAAINQFKKVININPDFNLVNYFIAYLYAKLKFFDESLDFLNEYLKKVSNNYHAYNLLGVIFLEKNNLDEAIVNFNKCISLKMDFVKAYNNLGIVYFKKKQFHKSINILQIGINLDPNFNKLYYNIAKSYAEIYHYLHAVNNIKIFLDKEPNDSGALFLLGYTLIRSGKILEGLRYMEKGLAIEPNNKSSFEIIVFNTNYLENINFNKYHNNIQRYKNIFLKYSKKNIEFKKKIINSKKIKIGFISADLNAHAVSCQISEVLRYLSEQLDFDLYAYYNSEIDDNITKELKSYFKSWKDIYNLNNTDLFETIKLDNIDILIDLSGHSKGNKLEIFFNKPAPIQVTWAGYLASTGLKEIDYIIGDNNSITEKEEQQFTEKIYRLSDTWTVLKPVDNISLNEKLPFYRNKYFTFGSLNNILKINNNVIKVWSEILSNIDNSKLILTSPNFDETEFKEYFLQLFISSGAKRNQLILEGHRERNELLNIYNSIDIALDTFPYNGGTTSLEASWMCVPILVKRGNSFLSKCGESINISLGLDDLICNTDADYIKKAVDLYKNIDQLQSVKNYLIKNRKNFKIFDSKFFADELSAAFKNMVSIYNNA